eukprot:1195756-Prorocentrum_minimum.AAC.6
MLRGGGVALPQAGFEASYIADVAEYTGTDPVDTTFAVSYVGGSVVVSSTTVFQEDAPAKAFAAAIAGETISDVFPTSVSVSPGVPAGREDQRTGRRAREDQRTERRALSSCTAYPRKSLQRL